MPSVRRSAVLASCLVLTFAIIETASVAAPSTKAPKIVERCAGQEPYATHSRPLPTARKAAMLLPRTIGGFTREDVGPQVPVPSDEDLNVTYKSGKKQVFIGISIPGALKDRQEAVRVTWQEAVADSSIDRTGERLCLGKDMSFYKLRNFYSWTRGEYFFYAQASDAKTLDQFIAQFPY